MMENKKAQEKGKRKTKLKYRFTMVNLFTSENEREKWIRKSENERKKMDKEIWRCGTQFMKKARVQLS